MFTFFTFAFPLGVGIISLVTSSSFTVPPALVVVGITVLVVRILVGFGVPIQASGSWVAPSPVGSPSGWGSAIESSSGPCLAPFPRVGDLVGGTIEDRVYGAFVALGVG